MLVIIMKKWGTKHHKKQARKRIGKRKRF